MTFTGSSFFPYICVFNQSNWYLTNKREFTVPTALYYIRYKVGISGIDLGPILFLGVDVILDPYLKLLNEINVFKNIIISLFVIWPGALSDIRYKFEISCSIFGQILFISVNGG